MGKFMLLFMGLPLNPEDGDQLTGEYMQEWGAWIAGLVERGAYDSGLPLEWSATAVTKDSVTDHPLDKVDLGGYMIINAASLDEAIEIAREAPNVALGGTIIVRPCLDIQIS